jgi:hypothetical protein
MRIQWILSFPPAWLAACSAGGLPATVGQRDKHCEERGQSLRKPCMPKVAELQRTPRLLSELPNPTERGSSSTKPRTALMARICGWGSAPDDRWVSMSSRVHFRRRSRRKTAALHFLLIVNLSLRVAMFQVQAAPLSDSTSALDDLSVPLLSDGEADRTGVTPHALSNFLAHATSGPTIRRVVFQRTKGMYTARYLLRDASTISNYGPAKYEGAIQENGFFLKHLTNSLYETDPVRPGEELIFGENLRSYWQMDAGHHVLGISPKESNTDRVRSRESICCCNRRLLDEVCFLGLEELKGLNFVFLNDTRFKGTNANREAVTGNISTSRSPTNSVVRVAYSVSSTPDAVYEVTYFIDGDRKAGGGVHFKKRLHKGEVKGQWIDYVLQEIDYGVDPVASKAYFPLDFRRKLNPLASLVLYTNNARFIVQSDGRFLAIDGYSQPGDPSAQRAGGPTFLLIVAAAAAGFCLVTHGRATNRTR